MPTRRKFWRSKEYMVKHISTEMSKQLAKELHKQPRLKFRHKLTTARYVNDVWAADLIDMGGLVDQGFRYILTIIDVLSRYARVVALKDKKKETISKAFHLLFAKKGTGALARSAEPSPSTPGSKGAAPLSGRKPSYIWTDRGGEFSQELIGVPIKYAYGPIKVGIIERFNKTLKHRMWYKMTKHGSDEWISRMPKIVRKYNDTVHSSIGMTPRKAQDGGPEIQEILLQRQHLRELNNKYKKQPPSTPGWRGLDFSKPLSKQLFHVGDRVRVVNPPPKSGESFQKGYRPRWSKEIFIVDRVIPSAGGGGPFTYTVKRDRKGLPPLSSPEARPKRVAIDKVVMQNYYNEELQKTSF